MKSPAANTQTGNLEYNVSERLSRGQADADGTERRGGYGERGDILKVIETLWAEGRGLDALLER